MAILKSLEWEKSDMGGLVQCTTVFRGMVKKFLRYTVLYMNDFDESLYNPMKFISDA